MENLPAYISIGFMLTTLLTAFLFYKACAGSKKVLLLLLAWLALQVIVGLNDFYTVTDSWPPRFALLLLPPLLLIIILFATRKGKLFLDSLDISMLTLLHTVRIPVELVLFGLYTYGTIPRLMTFEGRNFDILAGITAPFIYYYGFVQQKLSLPVKLAWNIICLALLLNIVVNAILSVPGRFQQLAFDQPNIALLYSPFTWLPCCVVPLVLFAHLATIRLMMKQLSGRPKSL